MVSQVTEHYQIMVQEVPGTLSGESTKTGSKEEKYRKV